ncbi:DUF502 domain-containing protein [Desulfurispirillum indicum]|uniref:DUF502 domain-containing protein n=1 Tax=Desulfurispirillum indicum (strain ATCC BAA-1389 / DSM 22839 / S5) TaxID=653733 RepID=E6W7C8_DESIS|nr:DUF502 domain-containing protein [Desulfurispirillum indicum]ADU66295.1 protein of unknown function DUF502 [Desulfurispirillum indicum S5]UCZ55629.1 DUF502 domain-containing protein [Desulfurispirillum indicum]
MKIYRYCRQTMVTGLIVILPATVTILVAHFLFQKIDSSFSPLVTHALISLGIKLPHSYRIPGIGMVGLLLLLFVTGMLTKHYVGRSLFHYTEDLMGRLPFAGSIHSAMRQLLNAFGTANGRAFKQVVCVEYPKEGIYSIGFLSTNVENQLAEKIAGTEMVYVFIPTTPNPTSGLLIAVPRQNVMHLDMSVEEGIKLVVSAGIVTPGNTDKKKPA